jgi:hypothetical protein
MSKGKDFMGVLQSAGRSKQRPYKAASSRRTPNKNAGKMPAVRKPINWKAEEGRLF